MYRNLVKETATYFVGCCVVFFYNPGENGLPTPRKVSNTTQYSWFFIPNKYQYTQNFSGFLVSQMRKGRASESTGGKKKT